MGHHCQGSSCSTGSSCCSQDHHSKGSCGCGCGCNSSCGCGCQNCNCSCHKQGKYADQLLHLADEAWMEVLKEKIKDEIRASSGEKLTEIAKLVSTTNHARWREKMQSKKECDDFECQLKNVMSGSSKK
jgi:hypothetical protein